jgi:3-oxoacyl-[acyl-carrier protein] reductase
MTNNAAKSEFDIPGRVAVVTGASSGIGRAIALALAEAGADVVVHARASRGKAESTAAAIRQLGRQAQVALCDLADAATHARLVDEAWNWQKRVDYWVNNAGADVLTGEAAKWPFERKLEQLWRVDVLGSIGLSRLVGERLRAAPAGDKAILNMGWDQAETGQGGDSGQFFAAAKGAVMAFSKSLARTLAPHVRVNCLAPGWIRTAWGEKSSAYWSERAKNESLLARWGTPEDVAQTARFLCSGAAAFITGQIVRVNGGYRGEYP